MEDDDWPRSKGMTVGEESGPAALLLLLLVTLVTLGVPKAWDGV